MACDRCVLDLKGGLLNEQKIVPKRIEIVKNEYVNSRPELEEYFCLIKHLLHAEGHTEENIANSARDNDYDRVEKLGIILDLIRRLRQEVVKMTWDK